MRKILLSVALVLGAILSRAGVPETRAFIRDSWEKSVRFSPEDVGTHIGMPFPYTVPSVSGGFQELYYWDLFFTNEGLIIDGLTDQARMNTENLASMVDRFGKILNGSSTSYLNRSQPPVFSLMVRQIYDATGDREWLAAILPKLEKEYGFWMNSRMTPCGLNHDSNEASDAEKMAFIRLVKGRFGENFKLEGCSHEDSLRVGSHYISEAECWDFTPRFKGECENYCPVDLNALLYIYEKNFAYFSRIFGDRAGVRRWNKAARVRKRLMGKYLRNPKDGIWYDYDFVTGERSDVVSAAQFFLLMGKAVTRRQARGIVKSLAVLEYPHGISACEKGDYPFVYQWSYPNGWAPLQYVTVRGLDAYGYEEDARRIARNYVDLLTGSFDATGTLWEKYNVAEGNLNVGDEYKMPTMLGWTAGAYVWLTEYLSRTE
jgi:alpha,alpha-trehalase